ncbi:MAG: hypothetical protein K2Q03_10975 [Sphingobacteriaceae bacterium]|nr:hypothetical protein [Sphingobacteriaceae bacterium]
MKYTGIIIQSLIIIGIILFAIFNYNNYLFDYFKTYSSYQSLICGLCIITFIFTANNTFDYFTKNSGSGSNVFNVERNWLVVFILFVYDKMFTHAPLQRLFVMEICFISIIYLMLYAADRAFYYKYHKISGINQCNPSTNNNSKWNYMRKTVIKYHLWLNWSIASFCMILAAISGAIIAFIYFNSSIIKDIKSFIPPNIEYRVTTSESSIKEQNYIKNDLAQLYETRLSGLEKDITDQNTMFSQQIGVLTALYNNSLMVLSIIVGLVGIILIFFGWALNRKFEHEYTKINKMSRNIRKINNNVKSSLFDATKESEIIVDGLKDDINKFINNSEDKLYHQYEKIDEIKLSIL